MDDDNEKYFEEEEKFFNKDAYNFLIKKYGMNMLSADTYINNDIFKEDIIVPNEFRQSSEIMTQAEYIRVVSERSKQIENGSRYFIELTNETEPNEIAINEIKQKKCPLSIVRYVANNKTIKEIWNVNEMIIPFK